MCVLAAVAAVVVVSIVIELVLHDRHGHRGPHSVELVRSRQLGELEQVPKRDGEAENRECCDDELAPSRYASAASR